MKEKILETLRELGFDLLEIEQAGYGFQYEGKGYMYVPDTGDDAFLSLSMPEVYEPDDSLSELCGQLAERINSGIKYVKAYVVNGSLWLFYEREILEDDGDLTNVMASMISRLDVAYHFAQAQIAELKQDKAENPVGDIAAETDDTNNPHT